ncbi:MULTISPECIES: methylamine utilization protein MauJ [unclassified Bradyrhizobium]|uniref:methylamine utilization protein MauJ n=1 Tax=unclassified Bradyrhizobium TaxID=2631580 RepID=UPI002915D30B|nr:MULTISPECIES: methylamine utilization protein MauJ [unclassified Bradyrhizobium]
MNASAPQAEASPKIDKPFWSRELPTSNDVIKGELAEPGEWVVANIQPDGSWPVNAQRVEWRGHAIWIIPLMKKHYPAVAMKVVPGVSRSDCEELLMRFVSNLSWVESCGHIVVELSRSNLPAPLVLLREKGMVTCESFDLSYFPTPTDSRAPLALALMREGRGLNHPAYSFLSFFRVLEVVFGRHKWKRWVEAAIDTVNGYGAQEVVRMLRAKGIQDIGNHLYKSGRCAIAHASEQPIVDPDKPDDFRRLTSEAPLIRALAQKAIEEGLGVETRNTVYRNHLHELAGFKKILGAEVIELLQKNKEDAVQRMIDIPDINVELFDKPPYEPLKKLTPRVMERDDKSRLYILFSSADETVRFRLGLDFAEERLLFSPFTDVGIMDTGSAASARRVREVRRFEQELFGNGRLRIVNSDTGEIISWKGAYIPVNMFQDLEGCAAQLAMWDRTAARRQDYEDRYGARLAWYAQGYTIQVVPKV